MMTHLRLAAAREWGERRRDDVKKTITDPPLAHFCTQRR